jgi:hypothetical protein
MKSFVHSEDAITMLFRLAESWFNQTLSDGGPRYAEYHPEYIIVEPWNAFSSVFMMIPAIFFFWKLRKDLASMPFMGFSVLMIFLGGLGSTLFHAFRMSEFFLMMDIIPSAILTIAIAVFFWLKILRKWWHILLIFIPVFALRFLLFKNLPSHIGINLSYAFSGILVLVPLVIVLYQTDMKRWISVFLVLVTFGLALLFRQLDAHQWSLLPQGTHFLWHLFSAIGSWYILDYLLFVQRHHKNVMVKENQK